MSHPAEDICQCCFVFLNCHRYFANHSSIGDKADSDIDEDNNGIEALANNDNYDKEINVKLPESAATQMQEGYKLLMLESAKHIRMARA